MLRVVPFKNAKRAHEYYAKALVKDDYYSQGKETAGRWFGKLARELGLKGSVKPEQFEALANNINPKTGEQLTQRNRKDRVVGADFNFGLPKSASILYAMTGDKRIVKIVEHAVDKMLESIENEVKARVRVNGEYRDRTTGNLICALFHHHTSRSVDGVPDPHYHTHGFVFNVTWDKIEKKYKALKFRGSKQNAPVHEAVMRSWIAKGFEDIGFPVRKVGKSFELVGFPRSLIKKFSRRTMQIEQFIAEQGITDAKGKDKIGAMSREAKNTDLTPKQILADWVARLDADDRKTIQSVIDNRGKGEAKSVTVAECVDYAIKHCFVTKSVVPMRNVFREAVAYGYGAFDPDAISAEIERRNFITGYIKGVEYCTPERVLREEEKIMKFVRDGKGKFMRLAPLSCEISRNFFSGEQVKAIRNMWASRNQVVALQGVSGGGKTTAMKEVVEGAEIAGKKVFVFAPIHEAVRTLKKDGFLDAKTLSSFLASPSIQKATRGHIIWVDEASMIGTEDMLKLCEIAGSDTRILLTGDKNQHAAIPRGEPFRVLQDYKILKCAKIKTVIRQDEGYYRNAAQALADGEIGQALLNLKAMGAIVEVEDDRERYRDLAEQYVNRMNSGESSLLISPTHAEGRRIIDAIRARLRETKRLGKDHEVMRLEQLQWSDVEKALPERYKAGYQVEFNQHAKGGFVRGSSFSVVGHDDEGDVLIQNEKGKTQVLNMDVAERFDVYQRRSIKLASGDLIRMTDNGNLPDGRRYYRGQIYQVSRIYPGGSIKLKNGGLLKRDYGHVNYGYVQTSYSSQSRTSKVPEFLVQSSGSFGANSLKQFYVSVTRGKSEFSLYTDNIKQLAQEVRSYKHELTAIEFSETSIDLCVSQEDNKSPYFKDRDGNDTISSKEYDAILNKDHEFRYTSESIRHDVGGSFVGFVEGRRYRPDLRSEHLSELRRAYMQGEKEGWQKAVGSEKKKLGKHFKKRRKRGRSRGGESQDQDGHKKQGTNHFKRHLDKKKANARPIGEVLKEKKEAAISSNDKGSEKEKEQGGKSFGQSKREQIIAGAKSKSKSKSPKAKVGKDKGKDKGKSKAVASKPSPKKVTVVRVSRGR